MAKPPDIRVRCDGQVLVGWEMADVYRDIESLNSTFSLALSTTPGVLPPIKRGSEVQILVGDTLVLTGHADRPKLSYSREACGHRITGRSRSGAMVKSSAMHKGGQWVNAKLERIVADLAKPFGVQVVVAPGVSTGAALADFKLSFGESCKDAISRAARLRGLLVTTDEAGRVLLTKAGTGTAPAEIRRGGNVIRCEEIGDDQQQYQTYVGYAQSNVADDWDAARQVKAMARDDEVEQYSVLVVQPDGNNTQADLQALVDHTARVRRGHAYGFRYTLEGWLASGVPWPVNARVKIYDDAAGLVGAEWLICATRLAVDRKEGPVTVVDVRPIEAYDTVPLKTKLRHRKADRKGRGRDGARQGSER